MILPDRGRTVADARCPRHRWRDAAAVASRIDHVFHSVCPGIAECGSRSPWPGVSVAAAIAARSFASRRLLIGMIPLPEHYWPNSRRQAVPVCSISPSAAVRRRRCSIGMPSVHSCIQSRANSPRSVSRKISRIASSLITRGPRVRIANSAVRLHRRLTYSSIPTSSITSITDRNERIALAYAKLGG